jgi:hypothetical protein
MNVNKPGRDRQKQDKQAAVSDDAQSALDLAEIAMRGHAFDFLTDEPDIYTLEDGMVIAMIGE